MMERLRSDSLGRQKSPLLLGGNLGRRGLQAPAETELSASLVAEATGGHIGSGSSSSSSSRYVHGGCAVRSPRPAGSPVASGAEGAGQREDQTLSMSVYYLVYCIFCAFLTGALLLETLREALATRREARWWRRRLQPWEEAAEAFVGAALCTETVLSIRLMLKQRRAARMRQFACDFWRIADAVVALLTLLCGVFFICRRTVLAEEAVEDFDIPILWLRFAIQPLRMVFTASMVMRGATQLRRVAAREVEVKPPSAWDPRAASAAERSALPFDVAAQLRELLPLHLRYSKWTLGYSPREHGTSMSTFYRRQAGPNMIAVRDAAGNIFGCFASEAWRPQSGSYGHAEAFVWVAKLPEPSPSNVDGSRGAETCRAETLEDSLPDGEASPSQPTSASATSAGLLPMPMASSVGGSAAGRAAEVELTRLRTASHDTSDDPPEWSLECSWAVPERGRVIQWSDTSMIGVGKALVVYEDFLRGSSQADATFGSGPLCTAGQEFVIRDFECWHVGRGSDWDSDDDAE
eukprot:TRINITY_DN74267_c0_g1_i1.p1 TRINITY_DN74267_c0_g1~~TRINITY_DN74267_c0_g1_i1.p1  ORF type:complete len:521 (-),score=74.15 TRINITY_DN74267_c0_g1_i1:9-1571(-)